MTNSKKDSELIEIINDVYQMGKWDEANSSGAYYGGGRTEALRAIKEKFISKQPKEEAWGEMWSASLKYLDMVRNYEPENSEDYYTYRDYIGRELIAELRELLNGDKG